MGCTACGDYGFLILNMQSRLSCCGYVLVLLASFALRVDLAGGSG